MHTPKNKNDVDFKRQKMVEWFTPWKLMETGIKALISSIFGAYSDKREIQSFASPSVYDYSACKEGVTIDYIADLGDGWDSTYSMAYLLAQDKLEIPDGNQNHSLPKGQITIMGGDEVYPTAKQEEYQNRLIGPYVSAFPKSDTKESWHLFSIPINEAEKYNKKELTENLRNEFATRGEYLPDIATIEVLQKNSWAIKDIDNTILYVIENQDVYQIHPHLFAIPGNHDWYDGLTSFFRLFCQNERIGGWQTKQSRSYFAIQLPHNWWLWAIDIQLDSGIDKPQLDYFKKIAQKHNIQDHNIIFCSAQPDWLEENTTLSRNLAHFEKNIIDRYGAKLRATLSGDTHHYSRYENNEGKQKIVAGGGGAYLAPTHHTKKEAIGKDASYQLKSVFPKKVTSYLLALRNVGLFPFCNWKFGLFMGFLFLVFVWTLDTSTISVKFICDNETGICYLLESTEKIQLASGEILEIHKSFSSILEERRFTLELIPSVISFFLFILLHSPFLVFFIIFFIGGMCLYSNNVSFMHLLISGAISGIVYFLSFSFPLMSILIALIVTFSLWTAIVIFMWHFSKKRPPIYTCYLSFLGIMHALVHLFSMLFFLWTISVWNPDIISAIGVGQDSQHWYTWKLIFITFEMIIIGGFISSFIIGLYLAFSDIAIGHHSDQNFSSQAIPHYKNYLKLQVGVNGDVTIYPIGIRSIPNNWNFTAAENTNNSWFSPASPIETELIEKPIVLKK